MRLLFWNINALLPTIPNFVLTHGSMVGFFDHHGVDIAAFQETKLLKARLTKEIACLEGFESFWAISREKLGYSGVVSYVRQKWSPVAAEVDCLGSGDDDIDREGRIVLTDHGAFVLLNVYVPNAGDRSKNGGERAGFKCRFLAAVKEKADNLRATGREVIIAGDLNIAASQKDVHAKLDYSTMYSPEEKALLGALLRDYHDVWRELHPDVCDTFTVWDEKTSARAFNEGVRIDYALVSPGLRDKVVSCEVVVTPPKWSDHAALVLEMGGLTPPPPHPPCPLSSSSNRQLNDPSQRSIASMFQRKRPAPASEPGSAATTGCDKASQPKAQKIKAAVCSEALPQDQGSTIESAEQQQQSTSSHSATAAAVPTVTDRLTPRIAEAAQQQAEPLPPPHVPGIEPPLPHSSAEPLPHGPGFKPLLPHSSAEPLRHAPGIEPPPPHSPAGAPTFTPGTEPPLSHSPSFLNGSATNFSRNSAPMKDPAHPQGPVETQARVAELDVPDRVNGASAAASLVRGSSALEGSLGGDVSPPAGSPCGTHVPDPGQHVSAAGPGASSGVPEGLREGTGANLVGGAGRRQVGSRGGRAGRGVRGGKGMGVAGSGVPQKDSKNDKQRSIRSFFAGPTGGK